MVLPEDILRFINVYFLGDSQCQHVANGHLDGCRGCRCIDAKGDLLQLEQWRWEQDPAVLFQQGTVGCLEVGGHGQDGEVVGEVREDGHEFASLAAVGDEEEYVVLCNLSSEGCLHALALNLRIPF